MRFNNFSITSTTTSITLIEFLNLKGFSKRINSSSCSSSKISHHTSFVAPFKSISSTKNRTTESHLIIGSCSRHRPISKRLSHTRNSRVLLISNYRGSSAERNINSRSFLRPRKTRSEIIITFTTTLKRIISRSIGTIIYIDSSRILNVFITEPIVPN